MAPHFRTKGARKDEASVMVGEFMQVTECGQTKLCEGSADTSETLDDSLRTSGENRVVGK
jgi:hypothetical protein